MFIPLPVNQPIQLLLHVHLFCGDLLDWQVCNVQMPITFRISLMSRAGAFLCILDMQAEINYLGQLRHPNLVKLIGYCLEDDHRLLVYEFMPKGSMENHLFRSEFWILFNTQAMKEN